MPLPTHRLVKETSSTQATPVTGPTVQETIYEEEAYMVEVMVRSGESPV